MRVSGWGKNLRISLAQGILSPTVGASTSLQLYSYTHLLFHRKMEFPPEWIVLAAEDFELATARDPVVLGAELMAQVRPNGRSMDHFRLAVGGSHIVTARFNARDIYANQAVPNLDIKWETWPRDVAIRRNMITSEWFDLTTLLQANEALDFDADWLSDGGEGGSAGPPSKNEELLNFLADLPERSRCGAAVCWAISIGPDYNLELVLQGMPASAAVLNGKPAFRG